ncbi:hypothetical protein GCM10009557_28870 [Virgisporangium ochraceum]|uniref:Glycosyl hydrolase family 32 N-terminal domain-containing protein n=1 Tax=Virgisporangium ochraceum TaxID=65505 RepID=A0A8J3ZX68_9ACTN|nr:hypothetical protein [Virgisporangium ochraceum]GIJ71762.1 hypothetical protein Voc01_066790 [Virgisporangium ochraceum]
MTPFLVRTGLTATATATAAATATATATVTAATLAGPLPAPAANTAYAFAYFTETPNGSGDSYALHLAVSTDGLNWTPLNQNNPVATPTAGTLGLRDPFILRKQDGTFVVLATDLKGRIFNLNNQYLHVWDSTNLTSFTGYRRVRMHGPDTHTWAPTAFWDAARGQYGIAAPDSRCSTATSSSTARRSTCTTRTCPPACSTVRGRAPARRTATRPTPAGCARATRSRRRCCQGQLR